MNDLIYLGGVAIASCDCPNGEDSRFPDEGRDDGSGDTTMPSILLRKDSKLR